jgi:hypothetical protein
VGFFSVTLRLGGSKWVHIGAWEDSKVLFEGKGIRNRNPAYIFLGQAGAKAERPCGQEGDA